MRLLKLVPENTNIKFLRWQWPTTIVSTLLMIASWVLIFTNGLNLGVDFVGGQMVRVTFTQSAAAPVAAAAAGGAAGGAAAAPAEAKDTFDVILVSVPADKKIAAIKAVREVKAGLGLAEAKALVEGAPKPVLEGANKADSDNAKKKLEEAGAKVEIK